MQQEDSPFSKNFRLKEKSLRNKKGEKSTEPAIDMTDLSPTEIRIVLSDVGEREVIIFDEETIYGHQVENPLLRSNMA